MTINKVSDLAGYLHVDVNYLARYIYNYTSCGAWFEHDDASITIGSIVEGSDAEFHKTLWFPFTSKEYDNWIDELEMLADEAWHEANDDEGEDLW